MAVNVRGVFLCYKHAAEQMIKQGHGGRILGASSVVGIRGEKRDACTQIQLTVNFVTLGSVNFPVYSATKFAVRGLTQSAGR